jgi:hypothetical protein
VRSLRSASGESGLGAGWGDICRDVMKIAAGKRTAAGAGILIAPTQDKYSQKGTAKIIYHLRTVEQDLMKC